MSEITQQEALGLAMAGIGERLIEIDGSQQARQRVLAMRFPATDGTPQELSVTYWSEGDDESGHVANRRLLSDAIRHVVLTYDKQKKLEDMRNSDYRESDPA